MKYHFEQVIANESSVDVALFVEHVAYWIHLNYTQSKNLKEGKYWTYNTMESLCRFFTFWTKRQIERVIKNAIDGGFIIKGCFNKQGYDRTQWYTLTDRAIEHYPTIKNLNTLDFPHFTKRGNEDLSHFTDRGNAFHQTVTTIPSTIPSEITNKKNTTTQICDLYTEYEQTKQVSSSIFIQEEKTKELVIEPEPDIDEAVKKCAEEHFRQKPEDKPYLNQVLSALKNHLLDSLETHTLKQATNGLMRIINKPEGFNLKIDRIDELREIRLKKEREQSEKIKQDRVLHLRTLQDPIKNTKTESEIKHIRQILLKTRGVVA